MTKYVYIHIPFCKKKCLYCDFNSYDSKANMIQEYIEALKKEIENYTFDKLETIYIGGGTPSFIDEKYIKEILVKLPKAKEITIEVNPCTVTREKLRAYKEFGINRISMGLQTTNDIILKIIGRAHTFKEFEEAYSLIKKEGFENINVDLMFGLPSQKIEDLKNSVDYLISLNPKHISCYSLILHNDIFENLPEDEEERNMYYYIKEALKEKGYNHYEISNFAKAGYESKHNLAYWNQEEYVGIGAGASSYINKTRYTNETNLEKYINKINNKIDIKNIEERQTIEDKIREYIILKLRLIEGVKIEEMNKKFNIDILEMFSKEIKKLKKEGLIEVTHEKEGFIRLTNKGLDFANIVWREFI